MPLYFFHIREGETRIDDPEGTDLAEPEAVRRYAVRAARSLLAAEVQNGRLPLDYAIEITDASGRHVDRVAFGECVTPSGGAVFIASPSADPGPGG